MNQQNSTHTHTAKTTKCYRKKIVCNELNIQGKQKQCLFIQNIARIEDQKSKKIEIQTLFRFDELFRCFHHYHHCRSRFDFSIQIFKFNLFSSKYIPIFNTTIQSHIHTYLKHHTVVQFLFYLHPKKTYIVNLGSIFPDAD